MTQQTTEPTAAATAQGDGQQPWSRPEPTDGRYRGVPAGGTGQQRTGGAPWPADPWGAPAGSQAAGPAWYGASTPPPGSGGQGPADPAPQPARPPRRNRGTLVAVALVAALVGGGTALGVGALTQQTPATTTATAPSSSAAGGAAPAPVGAVDWPAVAGQVAPSVVAIQVASQSGSGEGSGVVLDAEGHVLTNYHVAAGAGADAQMRVVLADGRVFDVEVVGEDAATDLAVLQVVDPPADLVPATFGESSAVEVGQPVMAVGNPLGLSDTVTTGIVSALDRPVTTTQVTAPESSTQLGFAPQQQAAEQVVTNAIQTDAAVNPGNSGGPLVDANGAVIGINSSIASTGEQAGSIGLGFAIPSDEASRIASELIATGAAQHAWLGVSLTDTTATADGTTRLAAGVADVVASTPAEEAGLEAEDAVVAVDGQPVDGAESLTAQVRERAPGTEVELTVVRGGQEVSVPVTLGTRQEG
ncbi:S1C family serine protease [Pseudokineococcus sp. 1T1Z-3]|uniref:S1C family serine protease n=1 Tax=Pseudokineococcus sp. 1T1Z-3 TaxID=3132745 RepID=UPI0030A22DE2